MKNNWCIKGCEELHNYFMEIGVDSLSKKHKDSYVESGGGLAGTESDFCYYLTDNEKWDYTRPSQTDRKVISFKEFNEKYRKYTFKEVKEKKLAIWCTKVEQAQKIANANGYKYEWGLKGNPKGFAVYAENNGFCPEWQDEKGRDYFERHGATGCIDFEQVIFEEKEMKDEKLIGYKLKPECKEYREAALEIIKHSMHLQNGNLYIDKTSYNIDLLRKAGVLDLWFEPVYKEENQKLMFGDVECEIEKGKGVRTEHGYITLEEIERVLDYIYNPPELAGWKLETPKKTDEKGNTVIKFGCVVGKLKEIKIIHKAIKY